MINQLCLLLAGFSIVSAAILLFAYWFFYPDMRKSLAGKITCGITLGGLALLQLAHVDYFLFATDLLAQRSYGIKLMILPAAFLFFGRNVLFPDIAYQPIDLVHLLPIAASLVMPISLIPGTAFLLGSAYTLWFAIVLFRLREQRGRFNFEMFFFGLFALMALAALALGLSLPFIDHGIYYASYSLSISLAMALIVAALLVFPELSSDIQLVAEIAYAKSNLKGVDSNQKVQDLERLMTQEKQYENESISLASVADLLELSSHQLSELINTKYGFGFPRFVREHRVRAARQMLINEPDVSILAISMATGFKSQSSFYTAFKETTGRSPGEYRREHRK